MLYDLDPGTLYLAAQKKYKDWKGLVKIEVSPPYWVDSEIVRVGICINDNVSFGANFSYKEGIFR